MTSILIKNGKIIDGTGNPWFKADLLIEGDKISKIDTKIENISADEVIDASGLIVSPGFIDIHTHSDLSILKARGENVLTQGVTTHVVGNCGFSVTPIAPEIFDDEDIDLFKQVLGFKDKTDIFSNLGEYLDTAQKKGIPINMIPLIGHSILRVNVMGLSNRAPTSEELQEMKDILETEMKHGAFGLSTGLDYPPGSFAKTDEIIELCKVASKYNGIYASHFRGLAFGLSKATKEAIKIAKSGISVQLSHLKPFGFWIGDIRKSCKLIERAREDGLDVTMDVFPQASNSTFLFALVPPWVYLSKDKVDVPRAIEILKKVKTDEDFRIRIHREINMIVDSFLNIKELEDWNKVYINAPNSKEYNGKHIYKIASERNMDPKDALIDILIDLEGAVSGTYLSITEEDNIVTIVHPLSMFGSDGRVIPEDDKESFPNPYCNGTFTRVLGKHVREDKLLTLQDAIRRMTSFPAQKLGLTDRGILKEGFWADITIFDKEKIIDKATYDNPRLLSEGVEHVIVNGVIAMKNGVFTGSKSGIPLRRK